MYKQTVLGFILLFIVISVGKVLLISDDFFYRMIIGLGFGYAMARASMGFAGSVNRLARTGSSALASALMIMFTLTAIVTAMFIYGDETAYRLNIYPINIALLIGGLMFGFGMTFSSCCATGSLTDLSGGFSRALVAIFFLGFGVFTGFSFQTSTAFVKESYMTSEIGSHFQGGVFLPDLFKFDGFNGYLGAIVVTALLASLVIYLAKRYEKYYHKVNRTPFETVEPVTQKASLFERLFVNPWKMRVSVVIIALLFGSLLFLYDKGWSASTAFGLWFAKLLMLLGISPESLAAYTGKSIDFITIPLFSHGTSVQNFAIILGAFFYLLIAGKFRNRFVAGLPISLKDFFIYAIGGFMMGFGTRLSNGCNVGALYTPIAEFSLSGWFYLVVVVIGGFAGNWFLKSYVNKSCTV
jgi:uncharacterized protein